MTGEVININLDEYCKVITISSDYKLFKGPHWLVSFVFLSCPSLKGLSFNQRDMISVNAAVHMNVIIIFSHL